jgi:type IV pilus assembly protein PilV
MHLRASQLRSRARGFSLIEVLVALIVICVGLLGVAKMQALALSNMTTSRLRALAAFEAAGLAAAMHSNRSYWANTPANFTITVNPASVPVIASSDGALSAQASADYAAGPGAGNGATGLNACVGTAAGVAVCATAVDLAAYDLARWTYSLGGPGVGLLPNPTASINCPNNVAGIPTSCTIQITWTEQAVSVTAQAAGVGAATCTAANGGGEGNCFENPSYLLYVEP